MLLTNCHNFFFKIQSKRQNGCRISVCLNSIQNTHFRTPFNVYFPASHFFSCVFINKTVDIPKMCCQLFIHSQLHVCFLYYVKYTFVNKKSKRMSKCKDNVLLEKGNFCCSLLILFIIKTCIPELLVKTVENATKITTHSKNRQQTSNRNRH